MSRALVRVIPKSTASKALDKYIILLVGFLWGVLLGGFAAYWRPRLAIPFRSRQRAELFIEDRNLLLALRLTDNKERGLVRHSADWW
jgi:hypothetical protein